MYLKKLYILKTRRFILYFNNVFKSSLNKILINYSKRHIIKQKEREDFDG